VISFANEIFTVPSRKRVRPKKTADIFDFVVLYLMLFILYSPFEA
jgi:hypothetical protein